MGLQVCCGHAPNKGEETMTGPQVCSTSTSSKGGIVRKSQKETRPSVLQLRDFTCFENEREKRLWAKVGACGLQDRLAG
ncbi:hypothetical protein AMTR_s00035p00086820 [Amborella trichopoda]|uniref:Uncharacterized protein n=1 Tax=Amborella trichopoda TaxID=13333 RepID=W1PWB4_AMBTC|nr:hypothetical protein AMTR_s00035p00086820 [Amborella trichopoda]